jgi:hypothetical protein
MGRQASGCSAIASLATQGGHIELGDLHCINGRGLRCAGQWRQAANLSLRLQLHAGVILLQLFGMLCGLREHLQIIDGEVLPTILAPAIDLRGPISGSGSFPILYYSTFLKFRRHYRFYDGWTLQPRHRTD